MNLATRVKKVSEDRFLYLAVTPPPFGVLLFEGTERKRKKVSFFLGSRDQLLLGILFLFSNPANLPFLLPPKLGASFSVERSSALLYLCSNHFSQRVFFVIFWFWVFFYFSLGWQGFYSSKPLVIIICKRLNIITYSKIV